MGILVNGLAKSFGEPPTYALKGVSFEIPDGDFVCITGRSGSGKSTLLYAISTLDFPTNGQVQIDGKDVMKMTDEEIHLFRNSQVGFVFQFHYLLPELTALENILMPARRIGQENLKEASALEWLDRFGLSKLGNRLPSQLSGGEQQRVAIARALIMRPKYLFADEPTGNLDSHNGEVVMNIFKEINKSFQTTIIYVTHDAGYAGMAKRQVELVDGLVSKDIQL